MTLCSNDFTVPEADPVGFDFNFYLFVLRLLAWLIAILAGVKAWWKRRVLSRRKHPELPVCYSKNEFGYVDMNGAY